MLAIQEDEVNLIKAMNMASGQFCLLLQSIPVYELIGPKEINPEIDKDLKERER